MFKEKVISALDFLALASAAAIIGYLGWHGAGRIAACYLVLAGLFIQCEGPTGKKLFSFGRSIEASITRILINIGLFFPSIWLARFLP